MLTILNLELRTGRVRSGQPINPIRYFFSGWVRSDQSVNQVKSVDLIDPNYSFLLKIIKMPFTIKLRNQFIKIYIKKYEQMFVSQLLYDLICNNLDSRLYHGCTVIGLCDVLQT